MQASNAVVVVVDRLTASYLGPYGNTWIDTPEFNRLASQSMLFEFALGNSPDLDAAYRAFWKGLPGFGKDEVDRGSMIDRLSSAGIATALVTDEQRIHDNELAESFRLRKWIAPPAPRACDDPADTELAQTFAASVEMLARVESPFCLWVHARGMAGAWDAPYDYRQQFADEDDPAPSDIVVPPSAILTQNYDPDELWGYAHAYAGQVLVLDACVGALMDALENSRHAESTLLIFTSPRGYPMGEHLRVGDADDALYSELLHVPLLIRHPRRVGATLRRQDLAQPYDLYATLMTWFGQEASGLFGASVDLLEGVDAQEAGIRDYSVARNEGEFAIRTPHWFFRHSPAGEELYVKPDDRHEANEVAARCGDITDELRQIVTHLS